MLREKPFYLLLIIFSFSSCQKKSPTFQIPRSIKDHFSEIEAIQEVDSLRWIGDYSQAAEAYSALENSEDYLQLSNYIENKKTYCLIKSEELVTPDQILLKHPNLSPEDRIDYLSNLILFYNRQLNFHFASRYQQELDSLITHFPIQTPYNLIAYWLQKTTIAAQHHQDIFMVDSLLNESKKIMEAYPELEDYFPEYFLLKSQFTHNNKNFEEALNLVNHSIELFHSASDPDSLLLGMAYKSKGESLAKLYQKENSMTHYQKAFDLVCQKYKGNQILQYFYEGIILSASANEDQKKFDQYYDEAMATFDHFPNPYYHPDCLKALWAYRNGKNKLTKNLYLSLINQYQNQKTFHTFFFDEAYFILQDIYTQSGQIDSAMYYHQASIDLILNNTVDKNTSLNIQVLGILKSRLASTSLSTFQKNLEFKYLKNAIQTYLEVDTLLFQESTYFQNGKLLGKIKDNSKHTYNRAIEASYLAYLHSDEKNYLNYWNHFVERLKYPVLHKDRRALANQKDLQFQQLETELLNIQYKLAYLKNHKEEKNKTKLILQLNKAEQKIRKTIKKDFSNYQNQKNKSTIPSISDLQEISKKTDHGLIQYFFLDSLLYTLAVRPDSVFISRQLVDKNLGQKITDFNLFISSTNNAIKQQSLQLFINQSHQLYHIFFQPIELFLKKQKSIIICQHQKLPNLPFAALIKKQPTNIKNVDFSSLPYLILDKNISYSFSLRSLRSTIINQQFPSPTCTAFGYGNSHKNQLLPDGFLPYSSKEIQEMKKNFDNDKIYFYIDKMANKAAFFTTQNRTSNFTHLALHASNHSTAPDNNKVIFPSTDSKNNTPLYAYEIENTIFSTDVIVLAACETNQGIHHQVEGIYSLTRSFLMAGIPQVVTTNWKIDDYATSLIINNFYKNIHQEKTVSSALNKGQRTYLKGADALLSFPGYWAGISHYY